MAAAPGLPAQPLSAIPAASTVAVIPSSRGFATVEPFAVEVLPAHRKRVRPLFGNTAPTACSTAPTACSTARPLTVPRCDCCLFHGVAAADPLIVNLTLTSVPSMCHTHIYSIPGLHQLRGHRGRTRSEAKGGSGHATGSVHRDFRVPPRPALGPEQPPAAVAAAGVPAARPLRRLLGTARRPAAGRGESLRSRCPDPGGDHRPSPGLPGAALRV